MLLRVTCVNLYRCKFKKKKKKKKKKHHLKYFLNNFPLTYHFEYNILEWNFVSLHPNFADVYCITPYDRRGTMKIEYPYAVLIYGQVASRIIIFLIFFFFSL